MAHYASSEELDERLRGMGTVVEDYDTIESAAGPSAGG